VIAVDTRPTTVIVPADPADTESVEITKEKAGKVWYPESSFKTAQSIKDFNRENLPLFILANWRGFSGGASDMFHEILKFGANIVDALSEYKQPIFVYLPPYSEVRGGAWVVIDRQINAQFIEMYSSETARGGVLEPNATASLKFRKQALFETMDRLDPMLKTLKYNETSQMNSKILKRRHLLNGIYKQIAIKFADLHDCPERMVEKGVIQKIVPWKDSRRYFYWRLRRRLHVQQIFLKISDVDIKFVSSQIDNLVRQSIDEPLTDLLVANWCDNNTKFLVSLIDEIKRKILEKRMLELLKNFPGGLNGGLLFLNKQIAQEKT